MKRRLRHGRRGTPCDRDAQHGTNRQEAHGKTLRRRPPVAAAFAPIEASWQTYEGTVRTKEPDLYLAIEDGFANLMSAIDDKDTSKADQAKVAIAAAADQYLAKHP
jgi:hypothetical protein